jgi:hypothetical protein
MHTNQQKNKQVFMQGECTDFLSNRRKANGQRIGLAILKKKKFPKQLTLVELENL